MDMADAIRYWVKEGKGHEISRLLLTNGEYEALRLTTLASTMTSRWLSARTGYSIQHASNLLYGLYSKGYLSREKRNDPTGGNYWYYTVKE